MLDLVSALGLIGLAVHAYFKDSQQEVITKAAVEISQTNVELKSDVAKANSNLKASVSLASLVVGCLSIGGIYLWRKKKIAERQAQDVQEDLEDNLYCAICYLNERNTVCLPCQHLAICDECLEGCREICPLCRTPIARTIRVHNG
eukprot:TRINITY_DN782069_c0_g1_i1.p1 TRINITY_DN782069_c0_g1~~TRINITY_DN782069_c0_g1_i1.p1  ORF type:complete len:146 (-),score=27.05 TRINITY_DN782069_c0_g1_i1:110-547(-)